MCDLLQGRNVVITGGTRGLGLLQAERALECGANHVTITSRTEEQGGTVADRDSALKRLSQYVVQKRLAHVFADVRRPCSEGEDGVACNDRAFDPAMRARMDLPRRVDHAILNAGIFGPGGDDRRLDVLSDRHFSDVMRTNCTGVFNGLRAFAQAQKEEPSENPGVVVVKSIYGSGGSLFSNAGYQASKFCAHGLTKQAAIEFARPERSLPRIRVNSVSPGFSRTDMTTGFYNQEEVRAEVADAHPTGTWVEGADVARAAVWLATANVTGVDLPVDNGAMAQSIPAWSAAAEIRAATDAPCCGSTQ